MEERRSFLSPLCSLTFLLFFHVYLSPFLPPPLSLFLAFFSLFYHSDRREERRPRTSLKSKSRRKDRREKIRGEENRAQDNSKLSHGPTQDGVRAALFADGRGTRLRIRSFSAETV